MERDLGWLCETAQGGSANAALSAAPTALAEVTTRAARFQSNVSSSAGLAVSNAVSSIGISK
jgi:hypothetical protein